MTYEAKLANKFDRHTGREVWAVEFTDKHGHEMRTKWTTIREEACAWGRIIRDHGWSTEGGGYLRFGKSLA